MGKTRLCLIGAGPSGMSFLYNLEVARKEGKDVPEVVCFDRQSNWGGLWNYTWRTGLDQHGEPVHGSMYRYLWSNGPKEALEFPDYTFEEHYGQTIPSFPPREVLFDYLQGRWKKFDLDRFITFNTSVKDVTYNANSDKFSVVTKNHKADMLNKAEEFDYKFPGRVLHAHDFRDTVEFKDKRLLIVGASYSAEDIALQCIKYGAKNIICSYRTKPWALNGRPLFQSAPLDQDRRKYGPFQGLYKGIVWTRSGNGKLLYLGAPNEFYTFTLFDMQALWALKYIMGEVEQPGRNAMQKDVDKWLGL
ncbi:hypothetical protein TCAL_14598 [Tigriopus californicus]|uniref:Flavin-containing monooxygenase n=1 Tax=Tigriopus californicus TaxID=6832 RepID=A0A553PD75_TIGCA|nr:hypothetical protein TCAL_14598 [Tigriopus californicus]